MATTVDTGRERGRPGWPLLLLSILLAPRAGWTLDPTKSLTQYLHTSWSQRDGLNLPPVAALAQTADGYLWLGTQKGLWRFDGVRFLPWQPRVGEALPVEDIWCLRAALDGGLWIGTAS